MESSVKSPAITQKLYRVQGMHCASCAVLINKVVGMQKGVSAVNANFGAERVNISFDESQISEEKIKGLAKGLGYTLIAEEEKTEEEVEEERRAHLRGLRNRTIISFLLASPVVAYYMAVHMFNLTHVHAITVAGLFIDLNWVYLIMTIPIQFWVGGIFYRSSWTAFRVGSTSMDTLVVLGTSAAFFYSAIGFLFSTTYGTFQTFWIGIDHPFWESSAALMSFLIMGRYLEAISRGRVSEAVSKLLNLAPPTAIIVQDGTEKEVPLKDVNVGDVFVVKPGSKVPTDGIVVEGDSYVDEKIVTGESMPVHKTPEDEVIGATVNTQGVLRCRATKVGKDTLLFQIVRMVREAQATRAPLQRTADWISENFVPAVIALSLITFNYWFFIRGNDFTPSLLFMVATLVISCPCAMGLATPIATMVGMTKAAEMGMLIKGGEALEKAHTLNAICFDKTGTLTKGEPAVTDVVVFGEGTSPVRNRTPESSVSSNGTSPVRNRTPEESVSSNGMNERDVVRLGAIVEKGSEHPLGVAIAKRAQENGLDIPTPVNFQAVSGMGVRGDYEGSAILVGNKAFMDKEGIYANQYMDEVTRLSKEAKTVVFVAHKGKVAGLLALADTLKPYAKAAVKELRRRKKEVIMITGDNEDTARAISAQIGIERFYANVLPQDKEKLIDSLQKEHKIVAMVGDGINDSPALAKSNLGIAVGSGTDVAIETGEIILIKDDLRDVVTAIDLSGKTIFKVWQNFFWAFVYNIVAIPVAAGLHLIFTQQAGAPTAWVVAFGEGLAYITPVLQSIWLNLSQSALRPEIAGFAMSLSSVSVVLNSLLLRRYKEPAMKDV